MSNITIHLKDGTKREFIERGRPGGSYCNSIKYVEGFVVVTDEWGKRTSIPTDSIKEIEEQSERRAW